MPLPKTGDAPKVGQQKCFYPSEMQLRPIVNIVKLQTASFRPGCCNVSSISTCVQTNSQGEMPSIGSRTKATAKVLVPVKMGCISYSVNGIHVQRTM